MSPELKTVIDFCLRHAENAPVTERVSLYRGLAEFCGDAAQAAKFRSVADELDKANRRCLQFGFEFLSEWKSLPTTPPQDGNGGKS